jgi:hypothetical protein
MILSYYFVMVETSGYTLEEMNYIFKQENPRNALFFYKNRIEESEIVSRDKDAKAENM